MKPVNIVDKPKTPLPDQFRAQNEAQPQQIYSYLSADIKQSMAEKYYHTRTTTKVYKNNIFHSTHKYDVSVEDPLKKLNTQNTAYNEFYCSHRKFIKPYGELTKYVNILNQNKHLLRRANFDTPIESTYERKATIEANSRKNSRYFKKRAQTCNASQNTIEDQSNNSQFYKTVSTQYNIFLKLLGKQRQNKDRKCLNNSLNRLLAAQSIYQKVNYFIPTKSKTTVKTYI